MRNRLAGLLVVGLAWFVCHGVLAATWSVENGRLLRRAGEMHAELAAPANAGLLAPRSDGGTWLSSGDALWSVAEDGRDLLHVDIRGAGLGSAVALASDAYDGSVWIATDASLLVHVMSDGTLAFGTAVAALPTALAVDLAQRAWLVVRGELIHFERDGRWLGTQPLGIGADEMVTALAIDAPSDRVWFASSAGVHHAGIHDDSGLAPVRAVAGNATALAVDQRRGVTLAIVDGELVAFDGIERRQGRDALPAFDQSVLAVDYDAGDDVFVVATAAETIRMATDGHVVERTASRGATMRGATPLRVDPVLALLRPPGGAAVADPHTEIAMRVGATCNDMRCDLPHAYLERLQLDAALDDTSLGEASIASNGRATFPQRPRMAPGVNVVTATVTDIFGHTATLERARWTLLPDGSPLPGNAPAEQGSDRTGPEKAANKSPSVTLTAPTNGARFLAGSVIALSAAAADPDDSIAKVEFYRGGSTLIGTATTAPYQYLWGNVPAGTYSLTAKAYDNRRATATSAPVTVIVVNNAAPKVVLTAPASGTFTTPGSSVTLTAVASDADGTITRVELFDGTTSLGAATASPYELVWMPTSPGHHSISATAADDAGAVTQSAAVDVVVGVPPVVIVTRPVACAIVDGPLDMLLTAEAMSETGNIARIEFFDGDTPVGVSTAAPWRVTLTGAAIGSHAITARATDNHGLATTSRPSQFTVRGANQPPTVAMTSPSEGARFPFGASITLAASASDADGSVTAVEFRKGSAGGALVARATGAPYTAAWTNVAAGSYTIVAVAFDDRNAATTSGPVHFIVDANVPPTVSITAPAANTRFAAPASVTVTATATDTDGAISKVEFLAGGTLIGISTAAPYSVAWNAVPAGTYAITARATDNAGGVTTSAPITLSVVSNALPTVSLTAPAFGAQFFAPATISLSASAQDSDGSIAGVDFYANGSLVAHVAAAPYRAVWDGAAAGTYALTAKATDNLGGATTSAPVSITLAAAPSISIDGALDGATIDDDNVVVRGYVNAPANSAVTVNGVVTHIDDLGHFQANDVPLTPGANAITAVVTSQDGQTASQTVTVNSNGPGAFVVNASPTEGLQSLQVTFTIENPGNAAFKQINLDLENDGFPNLIVTPAQFSDGKATIHATYPAGTWLAVIKAYDDQDNVIYSTSKSIVVLLPQIMQGNLQAIYQGMLARLRAGNIPGALTAITGSAYDRYNAIFTQLQPSLSSIVDQLGEVRDVTFTMDLAELSIVRNTPDGPQTFMLYMIRAEDGIWRIDGM